METEDMFFYGLIGVLYIYLMLVNSFFFGWLQQVLQYSGFIFFIAIIFLQDLVLQMKTAPYVYLECRLFPDYKKIHLFVKELVTRKIPGFENKWCTSLRVAFDVKVPVFQRVKVVNITHVGDWFERVKPVPGRANFKGFTINHPSTALLILYNIPAGSFTLDHAAPVPNYNLRFSPSGDYETEKGVGFPELSSLGLSLSLSLSSVKNTSQREELFVNLQRLLTKYSELESLAAAKTREAMDEHSLRIQLEEVVDHQRNELKGYLKGKIEWVDAVWRRMFDLRQEQGTIENALKSMKRPSAFGDYDKLVQPAAFVLVALAIVWFLWTQPAILTSFQVFMTQPINLALSIIALALVVVAIWVYRRGGSVTS